MVKKILCRYEDCVKIKEALIRLMNLAGVVSIADYYDTAKVSVRCDMHEYALGWDTLDSMKEIRVKRGDIAGLYFLKLPYPKVLG